MLSDTHDQPTPRSPEWLAGWDAGRAQVGRLASVVTRQRSELDISRGHVDNLSASLIQQGNRIERQQAYCDKLRAALKSLRRPHLLVDEDCWYSCPAATYADGSSGYCGPDSKCNCGADEYNALIDAALHPEPAP